MRHINYLLVLGLLLGAFSITGCTSRIYSAEGTVTTVIMLRHAEKVLMTSGITEVGLNENGKERAAKLPEVVEGMEIAAIYSPNLLRNIATVTPLLEQRKLEITLVDTGNDWQAVAQRLVSEHPGETVMWVGNTSNLEAIFYSLGGSGRPPIEYGDLFILRVGDKGTTLVKREAYGAKIIKF